MLSQEVPPTEYDIRFRCFGFPVRVHPWFWLTSAIVVWNVSDQLDHKLVAIVAVFLSILIHELGHAFAIRHYGGRSEIVLQMFGGYATSNVNPSRFGNIVIAAAGPAAGFLLWGVVKLIEYQFGTPIETRHGTVRIVTTNEYVLVLLDMLLWANWYWSLLNLLPVWPLDGGHIAHQVIGRYRTYDAWELTLKLSILVCVAVIGWTLFESSRSRDPDKFRIIMFALLAFQNFQTLQMSTRGRW